MAALNYHHLRYFREVAHEGNLSRAAERLNVSQSALSIQIKNLEDRLGHPLFERVGRGLVLTEVGRIALDHADRIFGAGEELLATLSQNATVLPPLKLGALSTLSRNFQMAFLRPAIRRGDVDFVLKSGNTQTLLEGLRTLSLDVVLTTEVPQGEHGQEFAAQRIADQEVGIHGVPDRVKYSTLRELLESEPLILPTDTAIRTGFEGLLSRLGITPRIAASVDDMAMVRLLAREGAGLAVAPAVVLADEIASRRLATAPFSLDIAEPFYAVTISRKYPHPMLAQLLESPAV
ncbi:LysR family transcriptional regulator [Pseudahrensia aquimaris]|uniref:LysR family transcriptional regulator n=1 Tax=Pseudahrensia aquimaris TaxID=744461 RepID=A0ABW3FBL7_9HYPH